MSLDTSAQTTLSGKILGEDGKGFENVSIELLQLPDSISHLQATTDQSGAYSLQIGKTGNYVIKYSAIGYQTQYSRNYSLKLGERQTVAPDRTSGG